jgi:hypothetical protein
MGVMLDCSAYQIGQFQPQYQHGPQRPARNLKEKVLISTRSKYKELSRLCSNVPQPPIPSYFLHNSWSGKYTEIHSPDMTNLVSVLPLRHHRRPLHRLRRWISGYVAGHEHVGRIILDQQNMKHPLLIDCPPSRSFLCVGLRLRTGY